MIVFTERVLEAIWGCFQASKRLMDTPYAPTKQAFLAQYTQLNPTPVFSWDDPVHGVRYQYDLRTNQVQLTPVLKPYARAVAQLNRRLGEVLPTDLLTTDDNWKKAWFRAARSLDIGSMRFIIEQGGIDVDRVDADNYNATALYHAVTPYGGSLEVVKLLVESGADLTHPANRVELLIEAGLEGVTSSLENTEVKKIAAYLQNALIGR